MYNVRSIYPSLPGDVGCGGDALVAVGAGPGPEDEAGCCQSLEKGDQVIMCDDYLMMSPGRCTLPWVVWGMVQQWWLV